jgi:AraC-like DNA-binding protein
MIWKKDKLKPTQPYFILDTQEFYQEVYLKQGISHFFSYRIDKGTNVRVVPDGCIDLFFEYETDSMQGFACGTPLQYKVDHRPEYHEVFGVRFVPGVQPSIINVTMRELCDNRIHLEEILKGDQGWLKEMEKEKDFYQRVRIFLEAYTKAENKKEKPFGKQELVASVKQMVYESDGLIRIYEIAEKSGYSERYINKVFMEEMGFSPKTFCKIIQFQRALEFLNYGAPDLMTDAATKLGYYDQSQFIRDFTKYAGITPGKYLTTIYEKGYKDRIIDKGV